MTCRLDELDFTYVFQAAAQENLLRGRVARVGVGADRFKAEGPEPVIDHGRDRFIISVHLTKTLLAGVNLMRSDPSLAPTLTAALNRFLHANMKGRHVLRTARQMRELVEQE